uniref:Uncharacterized protein n=1 Tax=Oryza punctata TaxID=4537 RepID=A0A0E0JP47_ORYPU
MKKKGGSGGGGGGGCLGAPFRALSRACDSACDLYVRGMSGCARSVPAAMEAVAVGRGFGRPATTTTMHLRVSSRDVEDLVRAASRQRRVAAEPAAGEGAGAGKKGGQYRKALAAVHGTTAGKKGIFETPAAVPAPWEKGAAMETIAEDAPCEFVADDMLKATPPVRRGASADGLAARPGGFGAIKVGTEAFER